MPDTPQGHSVPATGQAGELVQFTPYTAVEAGGAWIALCTCLVCGAGIVLDKRDGFDAAALHRRWHEEANRA